MLQELKIIPSLNKLKTVLTMPLGVFLLNTFKLLFTDYKLGIFLLTYLVSVQFFAAYLLFKAGALEKMVTEYEKGMYK